MTYMCPHCHGDGSCQTRNGFAGFPCIKWIEGSTARQLAKKLASEYNSSIAKRPRRHPNK